MNKLSNFLPSYIPYVTEMNHCEAAWLCVLLFKTTRRNMPDPVDTTAPSISFSTCNMLWLLHLIAGNLTVTCSNAIRRTLTASDDLEPHEGIYKPHELPCLQIYHRNENYVP